MGIIASYIVSCKNCKILAKKISQLINTTVSLACVCTYMCVSVRMRVYMCVCMHVRAHACMCVCVRMYMCVLEDTQCFVGDM